MYFLFAGLVTVIAAGVVYRAALHQNLASDYPADVAFTAQGIHTGVVPGNFLLETLMAGFALLRADTADLNVSLLMVLSLATGAKVALTGRFLFSESEPYSVGSTRLLLPAAIVGGLCALAFCFPAQHLYLGEIPPNVWHNPSTILLMPFALGLFWSSLRFLRDGRARWLWISLALGALNAAAKPSFLLCLLPVFPCAAFVRFGATRQFAQALLLTAAIGAILGLQYAYVYVLDPPGSTLTSSSGVILAPMAVWRSYTSDIPRALLASYAFPLTAVVLGGAAVWRNRAVQYALVLAAVGLIEYALLAEQGARESEGNLTWQAIVTQYILLTSLMAALLPWLMQRRDLIRKAIIGAVFAGSLWAGIHYLANWFSTKSFV